MSASSSEDRCPSPAHATAVSARCRQCSLWIERGGRANSRPLLNSNRSSRSVRTRAPHRPCRSATGPARCVLDSVRQHLVADVPVGVFLSAGLDSVTIAALSSESGVKICAPLRWASKNLPVPTTTRCRWPEQLPRSSAEAPDAGSNAMISPTSTRGLLDAMDQPSIDGVNSCFVAKAAHDAGLKVALSGLGGDELFAGYSHFEPSRGWSGGLPRCDSWSRSWFPSVAAR